MCGIAGIFNINGELVDIISNQTYEAGHHSIKWMPNDISSGLYIVSIQADNSIYNHKVLFLK